MELLYDILGVALFTFLIFLMYVNLHMEEEKVAGEHIPLMWEEGGWLYEFWNKHLSDITKSSKKK